VTADASERTGRLSSPALVAAARTDRGPRERNEDAFVCRPDLGLLAAIDGMGGMQAGERAAALAKDALIENGDPARGLAAANDRIRQLASQQRWMEGMGCVVSAVRVKNGKAQVAHVGDTRVYLAGSKGTEQLTRDHTVAATRQEELGISESGAREIAGRNQVTRDVGGKDQKGDDWIDRMEVDLEDGDVLVLCSDGLHGAVPASDLFNRLRQARRDAADPASLADGLVDLALQQGTRDNVTVVVARYQGGRAPWWNRDIRELFSQRKK
jgi:serine/threonine protein phosphatase PrpC